MQGGIFEKESALPLAAQILYYVIAIREAVKQSPIKQGSLSSSTTYLSGDCFSKARNDITVVA